MKNLVTLLSGLMFGFGLLLSGMANPAKVQNFLDLFGTWDPSLAFVMGGVFQRRLPSAHPHGLRRTFDHRCSNIWRRLGFRRILPRSSNDGSAAGC